ncbi:MAG: hypothetical protein JSU61_06745 [Fidelibacterota bacterium]|nr:MAG: hypothetical protein JSU61_06745 [Candidatus Neomarinimicrobiota bacterium]
MHVIFKPGSRTYVLSGMVLVSALLLQAHAQGVLDLAPMMKLTLTFVLTVVAPLVPVFIRKAIAAIKQGAKPEGGST